MVRLRSNRWYSADGQRRSRTVVASSASGTRRLLSLCFLLGLVIIMMQKAADPQHVRRAFNALGVPLDEPEQNLLVSPEDQRRPSSIASKNTEQRSQELSSEQRWTKVCGDLIDRLLGDASRELINELSLRWFAVEPSTEAWTSEVARDSWYAGTLTQLEALASELDEQVTRVAPAQQSGLVEWRGTLERFREIWEDEFQRVLTGEAPAAAEVISSTAADPGSMELGVFRQQLTTSLDRRLMANLRDAATWSKRESVPFWRLLQRAGLVMSSQGDVSSREVSDPPLFNTLQLQAETTQRKGTLVRFRGSVRRIEWVPHTFSLLPDSEGYWLLWLRGADLSDQPVAVYTTHRLPSQLHRSLSNEVYPDIEVLGLIGKKLAYSATSGVEVAPTLFAASLYQRVDRKVAPEFAVTNSRESIGRELQIALLGGLFAAGLILVPILSAWSRKGRGVERRSRSRVVGRMGLLVMMGWSSSTLAMQEPHGAAVVPPWAQIDPAKEMAGVLQSQIASTFDQRAVTELQNYLVGTADRFPDTALKLAYMLRKLQRPGIELPELAIDLEAAGASLEAVELSGSARLAMPVALGQQQQLWFQADDYPRLYRLEVETLGRKRQAGLQSIPPEWRMVTVYCEQVPSSWMTAVQLRQPVMVRGLAITLSNDSASGELLCVFAKSVQWKLGQGAGGGLAEVQPPLSVHSQQLLVAGWDLSHLDVVRVRQQKPLEVEDIEPFYSLLAVAERMAQPREEQGGEPLFAVLKEPANYAAAPIAWPVRVVRGTEVQVEPRAADLLGSSSYFQFDGFVDIGRKTIQYRTGSESDAEVVSFQGEFPITLVARSCPVSFAPPLDVKATSWDIGQSATARGLFFRLWSYESERMNAVQSNARQAAPLVVLQNLQPRVVQVVRTDESGWFGYALMVVMVAISGSIIWLAVSKK